MNTVSTFNPATGEKLTRYEVTGPQGIDAILDGASRAQSGWRRATLEDRIARIREVERVLMERQEELALVASLEMGKPVMQARSEVAKCATVCSHVAEHGVDALSDVEVYSPAGPSHVSYQPLGVVFAVMPWNYPFWQVVRFAIPAILAGNAVVLKHAPNVTGCAKALESLMSEAGLGEGLFSAIVLDPKSTGEMCARIIVDDRVSAVTFTGSNATGSLIARAAGLAVKKSVLELGGSDPFVVLADADLNRVVPQAVTARLTNSGQTCLAAKRFIVDESILDEFCDRYVAEMDAWTIGMPDLESTQIGPLARPDLAGTLAAQVAASVAAGAVRLGGSHTPPVGDAWSIPALLRDVSLEMPVMAEETFGPTAAVIAFAGDAQAITLANATRYGLAASVWSSDAEHALEVGRGIDSGCLFVNAIVVSDAYLPLGGVKQSGFGRELGSAGMREFVNVRSVVVHDA